MCVGIPKAYDLSLHPLNLSAHNVPRFAFPVCNGGPLRSLFSVSFGNRFYKSPGNLQGSCDSPSHHHRKSACLQYGHGLLGAVNPPFSDHRDIQGGRQLFHQLVIRTLQPGRIRGVTAHGGAHQIHSQFTGGNAFLICGNIRHQNSLGSCG